MFLKCSLVFLSVIPALLIVGFITLMERKILGLSQLRLGPNKVGWVGIPQPLSDAIKLFSKTSFDPRIVGGILFMMSPTFMLIISMCLWVLMPFFSSPVYIPNFWIFFMFIMSLAIYPLLISGWSSSCLFSNLGSLRAVAQLVSYETLMGTFIFLWMGIMLDQAMKNFASQYNIWLVYLPSVYMIWLMICLAETNRTPFDFSEGESELVSGFNTEYASQLFALIFMSEYLSIIILSVLLAFLLGSNYMWTMSVLMMFIWIWTRSTYPRHRYDKLMILCWKSLLPVSLLILGLVYLTLILI